MGKYNRLAIETRPDISFAIARLQRASNNPSVADVKADKAITRYLMKIQHGELYWDKIAPKNDVNMLMPPTGLPRRAIQ
jgi:hypothetical protein